MGDRTAYPELSAITGPVLPDYRGIFLRGYGGDSGPLGALQGDAIRNITGTIPGEIWGVTTGTGVFTSPNPSGVSVAMPGWTYRRGDIAFDASRVVPTSNENRPVNRAVVYLMRAR